MKADKKKAPWPTKDAMTQVYSKNLWGGDHHDFYSGTGSHLPELVEPYLNAVTKFLTSFEDPPTVCDLGCGDFNVGHRLVQHAKHYVAIDIVPSLIDRNRKKFKEENLEFVCSDIAVDDLPSGDCVILRQVLQHLSNAEVQRVVEKLAAFKYVILTEHVPVGNFTPNLDIISGQGTRLKKQSSIDILNPPFNFIATVKKQLLSVVLPDGGGIVETTLFMS